MNVNNKIGWQLLLIFAIGVAGVGCQKMERPALGDYPKDVNPPGGPLKFYAALDSSAVDSIRANFGIVNNATFVDGISGEAMQADPIKRGYVSFPSANDFGASTDFSIAFWIKATVAQKDHVNADGILAFGNSKNFWGNVTIYAEHETSTSDSMPLKIHFNAAKNTDNWQAQYVDNKRWPAMYDGNWHHIAITYSAADSVYTAYRDGVQFDQMTMNPAIKFENASQLVLAGYEQAVGVSGTYEDNPWMGTFPGMIDQVRLYGTTLSAADVAGLYNNKQ